MLCDRTGAQRRSIEPSFREFKDKPYDLGLCLIYEKLLLFFLAADLGSSRFITERHHSAGPETFCGGAAQTPPRVEGGLDYIFLILP
ncbi:hypothetical protein CHX26_00515 [Porphyrobacter sp. HT-58-2]|nr:hypothetical protein CHX26_00515 [Porphyrobacter sp. HT-58-2]